MAVRTGNVHIRQELHVQTDDAGAVAAGATQGAGIVGEIACLIAARLRVRRFGIELAQLVMRARIGRDRRADVDANRRRVDELDMRDAVGRNGADMRWQCAASDVASSAGIRLSSTMVVLPEPDTPVTTVRRPLGISTSSGLTVWMESVERWIVPFAKSVSFSVQQRSFVSAVPARKGPI